MGHLKEATLPDDWRAEFVYFIGKAARHDHVDGCYSAISLHHVNGRYIGHQGKPDNVLVSS